jgi:2-polyprenyl-3-methyl-5-hydroxy-6-metoxy-1,4-benzoquinol methylase
MVKTKEPQFNFMLKLPRTRLGLIANQVWRDDPKRLCFTLSRYKFVAKLLSGKRNVLEVGCGDAFASRIVFQEVNCLTAIDFDPIFIKDAKSRCKEFECKVHDILDSPVDGCFDAVYAIDVLEHIPKNREYDFMDNIYRSLSEDGVVIIGTPSVQSQVYASKPSKEGHINCKDYKQLKELMNQYCKNLFLFSMNDEVVHTGFYPMAHYLFAVGVGKR